MLTAFVSAVVLKGLVSVLVLGAPVRDVVALVARQTGEDLRVRDDANLNTIVVRVEDVELEVLLAKIADVTGARWQIQGERRTLVTDDETNAALQNRERSQREAMIARALDLLPDSSRALDKTEIENLVARAEEIGKVLEVWIPDDTQRAVLASIRESRPVTRLARQVALQIGAGELAKVEAGQKHVYSTAPQGSEKRLSRSAADALRTYAGEYAYWRDAAGRSIAVHPVKNPEDPRFGLVSAGTPAILVVEVSRPVDVPRINVIVRVADDSGNVIESGYQQLSFVETAEKARIDPDIATNVPYGIREVQAFLTFAQTVASNSGPVEVSVGPSQMLRDPLETEPIAICAGRLLFALSKATKQDLVACVPDTALEWSYRPQGAIPDPWSVNDAFAEIGSRWQCSVQLSNGWMVVAPTWITDSRKRYFARGSLKELLSAQRTEHFVSIDRARAYAASQRSSAAFRSYDSRLVMRLMEFSGNVADAHLIHWENEGPLRIIGAMTDAELDSARQGVRVSDLGEEARVRLREWMLGPTSVAQWFRTVEDEYGLSNVRHMSHRVLDSRADLVLRIEETTEPMSFQLWRDAKLPFADLMEWSGRVYEEAVEPTNGMKVQIGTLRRIRVRLEAAGVGFVSYDIEQAAAPPGEKWVLPRELAADQLRPFKEAYERSKGGAGGAPAPQFVTPPLLERAIRTS